MRIKPIVFLFVITFFPRAQAQVYEKVFSFTDTIAQGIAGSGPKAAVIQGSDGNFYGTTVGMGPTEPGTAFKMTPAGVVTPLVQFNGFGSTSVGGEQTSGLFQGSDGNFYGTTECGGSNGGYVGGGTVFKMTPTGILTTLVQFAGSGGGPGSGGSGGEESCPLPNGLIQGIDGNFYGTAAGSGTTCGSVFKMTPAGVLTTLLQFVGTAATTVGRIPTFLLSGSAGFFYGTTSLGGTDGFGTVFKTTTAGALTTLVQFTGTAGNLLGATPNGLLQGSDGNFYGTTSQGGACNDGTVFKMTPAGAFTTFAQFTGTSGATLGNDPVSPLVQGPDGNFYGTTYSGGAANEGTVLRRIPRQRLGGQ